MDVADFTVLTTFLFVVRTHTASKTLDPSSDSHTTLSEGVLLNSTSRSGGIGASDTASRFWK